MDVAPPEHDASPAPPTKGTRPPGELDHRAVTIVTIVACVAIIAVIGGAMAVAGGGGDAASTTAAPSPTAIAAPQTMDAHPAAFVVVLTWAPGDGLPVSYYAVTRDGRPITTLPPTKTASCGRGDRDPGRSRIGAGALASALSTSRLARRGGSRGSSAAAGDNHLLATRS